MDEAKEIFRSHLITICKTTLIHIVPMNSKLKINNILYDQDAFVKYIG